MKRSILISVFALLVLSFALILTNCGSSGGGGGDGDGGGGDVPTFDFSCTEAPAYDISGTWDVADTACNTTQCSSCDLNSFTATIIMTDTNTFSFNAEGEIHSGRICGTSFGITGTTYSIPSCDLGEDLLIVGTLSSGSYATTGNAWTCYYSGGSCSGTSTSIATKRP